MAHYRLSITAVVTCVCGVVASHAASINPPSYINAAVADPGRPPWEIARDKTQNPAQTMAFAGIKPGDAVVDFMPSAGYYTRILSKIVGPKGRVYSFVPLTDFTSHTDRRGPEIKDPGQNGPLTRVELAYAIEDVPNYKNVTVLWESITQYGAEFSVPEQVDAVVTADGYHAFHGKDFPGTNMAAVDKEIFRSLKPGGAFLVIDHAAAKGTGFSVADTLERSDRDAVQAEVLSAGFTFDGASDAAANLADNKATVADGSSDDFVLRFRKPLSATGDKRPGKGALEGYFGNTEISNIGAMGKITGERERRVFYHADGTYEEFGPPNTGNNPWQMGSWFWSADGHNCQLHEWPVDSRGLIVCHELEPFKKVGDHWTAGTNGMSNRHPVPETIVAGYQRY